MKKKVPAPKKTIRRIKKSPAGNTDVVVLRRIVVISACIALVSVGGSLFINRHGLTRAVAGASIVKGLFMQTTVEMPAVPDSTVASYNIYYKEEEAKNFTDAVRDISPRVPNYTISYLKNDTNYVYRFAAVDSTGKEVLFSETKPLTDLRPM